MHEDHHERDEEVGCQEELGLKKDLGHRVKTEPHDGLERQEESGRPEGSGRRVKPGRQEVLAYKMDAAYAQATESRVDSENWRHKGTAGQEPSELQSSPQLLRRSERNGTRRILL